MSRRHISFVLALSVSTVAYAAPALSQAACAPEKLNAAVDAFAAEPFSAATWRMLNGLGAPEAKADGPSYSGYAAADILSLGFKTSPSHAALLRGTRSIRDVDLAQYDGIFVVGGQSPMITMIGDSTLHAFVARAYETGKIVAIVCHGTCVLLRTRLSNGDLLVKGKTWTGFANSEEAFADSFVGQRIQPFWIEEEARKIEGTNFVVNGMFKPFALRDGNLITGQQQNSGAAAAALVVEALGR